MSTAYRLRSVRGHNRWLVQHRTDTGKTMALWTGEKTDASLFASPEDAYAAFRGVSFSFVKVVPLRDFTVVEPVVFQNH